MEIMETMLMARWDFREKKYLLAIKSGRFNFKIVSAKVQMEKRYDIIYESGLLRTVLRVLLSFFWPQGLFIPNELLSLRPLKKNY